MPVAQFKTLTINAAERKVMVTGTLELDPGEEALVICIRICQNGVNVAACGPEHTFTIDSNGEWNMDAEFVGTADPVAGAAIAAAAAVTTGSTPCQMNCYEWTQPQTLV